jgi:hypothetical protein
MPIGWAFLGFDGSLCSSHAEPEHRARGLAGVVGREVMEVLRFLILALVLLKILGKGDRDEE